MTNNYLLFAILLTQGRAAGGHLTYIYTEYSVITIGKESCRFYHFSSSSDVVFWSINYKGLRHYLFAVSSAAEVGWYLFIYSAPIGNILMMGGSGGGRGWPPRSLRSPPHWTHLLLESSDWSCNSMFTNQKYRIFSHSKLQSCAPISTVCRIYYNNLETLLDRVACELVQNSLRWVQCAPWLMPRPLASYPRISAPYRGAEAGAERSAMMYCFMF